MNSPLNREFVFYYGQKITTAMSPLHGEKQGTEDGTEVT